MAQKNKKKRQFIFEVRRKAVHVAFGTTIAFLIYYELFFLPLWLAILLLGFLLSHFLKKGFKLPFLHDFVFSFGREKEIKKYPLKGALFFLLGGILSYIIFEPEVAVFAILTLIVGDTTAALYGIYFGKIKSPINPKKHIDATFVGVFANTFFALVILPFAFWQVFLASLIGLFSESIMPFDKVEGGIIGFFFDDNIFIPLIVGLSLFFLM